jgi:hypothetical protein
MEWLPSFLTEPKTMSRQPHRRDRRKLTTASIIAPVVIGTTAVVLEESTATGTTLVLSTSALIGGTWERIDVEPLVAQYLDDPEFYWVDDPDVPTVIHQALSAEDDGSGHIELEFAGVPGGNGWIVAPPNNVQLNSAQGINNQGLVTQIFVS